MKTNNNQEEMMKGNEKDCICSKSDGLHEENCDAYRLSEFFKKVGAVVVEQEELWVGGPKYEPWMEDFAHLRGNTTPEQYKGYIAFISELLHSKVEQAHAEGFERGTKALKGAMVKEDWEKKYCKTFGLCIDDGKKNCQCREEKSFIRNLLIQARTDERNRLKDKCLEAYAQGQSDAIGWDEYKEKQTIEAERKRIADWALEHSFITANGAMAVKRGDLLEQLK